MVCKLGCGICRGLSTRLVRTKYHIASATRRSLLPLVSAASPCRDGRKLGSLTQVAGQAAAAEPTRRSMRARTAPGMFSPEQAQHQAARPKQQQTQQAQRAGRGKRRTPSPDEQAGVRVGAEHQAVLPAVRPRPNAPSAEEARWLAGQVGLPAAPALPAAAEQPAAVPAASADAR